MNEDDRRESALILASNSRLRKAAVSDIRPCRICYLPDNIKKISESLLGTGLAMRPVLDLINDANKLINPDDSNISMRTLEQHRKNHLPIRLFMQREVVERRASAASKDIDQSDGSILTPAAYAEIMMNAGAEGLVNNPESVSPMEGLAAAKTLHDFDTADNTNLDIARMVSQLNSIILAVKAVCSPDQLATISSMMQADKQVSPDDVDVF